MGTVVRRNALNGEVPRPSRPFYVFVETIRRKKGAGERVPRPGYMLWVVRNQKE